MDTQLQVLGILFLIFLFIFWFSTAVFGGIVKAVFSDPEAERKAKEEEEREERGY